MDWWGVGGNMALRTLIFISLFSFLVETKAAEVQSAFSVKDTLPSGTERFRVSSTSATLNVPLVRSTGSIQSDSGALILSNAGANSPAIYGTYVDITHASNVAFALPATPDATFGFTRNGATLASIYYNNAVGYPSFTLGNVTLQQTASGKASCSGEVDFNALKVGGVPVSTQILSLPLLKSQGGTGIDLSSGTGLVKFDEEGDSSIITDNSSNWNAAYGWGNHAGLYLGLHGNADSATSATSADHAYTAADSSKLGGHLPSYFAVAGSLGANQSLDTDDSPTFAGLTLSAIGPTLSITNQSEAETDNAIIQFVDENQYSTSRSQIIRFNNSGGHELYTLDTAFGVRDTGGVVASHSNSLWTISDPILESAVATNALVVGDTTTPTLQTDTVNKRVGIGTPAPGYQLHVKNYSMTGGAGITLENATSPTGSNSTRIYVFNPTVGGLMSTYGPNASGVLASSTGFISTKNVVLGSGGSNAVLTLYSNNQYNHVAYQMRLAANGYLGVGKLLPSTRLDVAGDISTTGTLQLRAAHTPSSASDTGTQGTITWDDNFIYVCTASNTWKRTAISSW